MGARRKRFAPYTVQCRNQLQTVSEKDQIAFRNWWDGFRDGPRNDNLGQLPSSQLPSKSSFVYSDKAQLFAIIDTCSIIKFRNEFIDFVTNLRKCYSSTYCPVKFIVPIVVLEELDKCNRPVKKRGLDQRRVNQHEQNQQLQHNHHQQHQQSSGHCIKQESRYSPPETDGDRELLISDLLQNDSPPRQFMRFIEQEMRDGLLLIGDLDPCKVLKIPTFEIVNHDDRILESSKRAIEFIKSQPHHSDTRVVLVTEDNIFKAKASTYEVASFRWREFVAKYHNFGKKNCVTSPDTRKSCIISDKTVKKDFPTYSLMPKLNNTPELKLESVQSLPTSTLRPNMFSPLTEQKLPQMSTCRKVCENSSEKRSTSIKIKATRKPRDTTTNNGKDRPVVVQEGSDITIVREVINLN